MTGNEKQPLFDAGSESVSSASGYWSSTARLDDDTGTVLATQLLSLASDDPRKDIALWIHSPGGLVPAMLAIRDVMRLVPCDVATLALGLARSVGQFPLSAGRATDRFVTTCRARRTVW
jgi:ATP-dependent Clp protease protease subunit